MPSDLVCLGLGQTNSKKPKINAINRFKNLKNLSLDGQAKGIESINQLKYLEKILLTSISTKNLDFLEGLSKLEYLDVSLGGIKDFSALESLITIKYLELWQVRGLSDLSFISKMTGLTYLFLQSLKNVKELPDFSNLVYLKKIYIDTLKGLEKLASLASAPALESFSFLAANNLKPEDFEPLFQINTLKKAAVYFGSIKKNNAFEQMQIQNKIETFNVYANYRYEAWLKNGCCD